MDSNEFLDRLLELYYSRLGLPNLMRKTDYHRLVRFLDPALIDADVVQKLDLVVEVAARAQPRG